VSHVGTSQGARLLVGGGSPTGGRHNASDSVGFAVRVDQRRYFGGKADFSTPIEAPRSDLFDAALTCRGTRIADVHRARVLLIDVVNLRKEGRIRCWIPGPTHRSVGCHEAAAAFPGEEAWRSPPSAVAPRRGVGLLRRSPLGGDHDVPRRARSRFRARHCVLLHSLALGPSEERMGLVGLSLSRTSHGGSSASPRARRDRVGKRSRRYR